MELFATKSIEKSSISFVSLWLEWKLSFASIHSACILPLWHETLISELLRNKSHGADKTNHILF